MVCGYDWTTGFGLTSLINTKLFSKFHGFYLILLNSSMANDKLILTQYFEKYARYVTHVAVAHSSFHPCNATDRQIEAMLREFQDKQLRHFIRRFGQALYQAKALRKPERYMPLIFTTIEGARASALPEQTIHANFALGHLPAHLGVAELKDRFTECWVEKARIANNDIWLDQVSALGPENWFSYITKEAERGNGSTWDFENSWIPHQALALT